MVILNRVCYEQGSESYLSRKEEMKNYYHNESFKQGHCQPLWVSPAGGQLNCCSLSPAISQLSLVQPLTSSPGGPLDPPHIEVMPQDVEVSTQMSRSTRGQLYQKVVKG